MNDRKRPKKHPPQPKSKPRMTFRFFIGGYFGTNHQITYKAKALQCNEYDMLPEFGNITVLPVVNNPDWEKLLRFLRTCNSERQKTYHDSSIMDGTQWELKCTMPGKKLSCSGSNQYPADFKHFLRLLNKITAPVGFKVG